MRFAVPVLTVILACSMPLPSFSAVLDWTETNNGDFSNFGADQSGTLGTVEGPTLINLDAGVNRIRGTTGFDGTIVDRDYFYFTLSAGQQLDSIFVREGTQVGANATFIAVQLGDKVTLDPMGRTPAGLLGFTLYNNTGQLNTNILDDIGSLLDDGAFTGATGFSGPLGPGTYAFWVQDTAFGTYNYHYEFNVSGNPIPTPLPGAYLAMLSGLGVLGMARRRRAAGATSAASDSASHSHGSTREP